jgi:hypothetical protein
MLESSTIKSRSLHASIEANNIGLSIVLPADNASILLPVDLHRPDILKITITRQKRNKERNVLIKNLI